MLLEVKNITKTYPNGNQALQDISFSLEKGEFVSIIGPSGAGKSTILRTINRLIEADSGRICFEEREMNELKRKELRKKVLAGVGVVPSYRTDEIDQLYFNLAGMPTDEISKKAFSPDEIKLEFPIDTHGPAIDKILQEEHDLILVGDETPEKGTANMEKRVAAEKE